RLATPLLLLFALTAQSADAPTAREALKPFNDLVGSWRGTGEPEGSREVKNKGFWLEKIAWEWQFKDKDVWMKIDFTDGKYFRDGELRYLSDKKQFRLTVKTPDKKTLTFDGPLEGKRLTLERQDAESKE